MHQLNTALLNAASTIIQQQILHQIPQMSVAPQQQNQSDISISVPESTVTISTTKEGNAAVQSE